MVFTREELEVGGVAASGPLHDFGSEFLGKADLDPYSCQCNDQASLVCLAIAKAGDASGTAIKDAVRKISQGAGTKVDDVVDGLKLLAENKLVPDTNQLLTPDTTSQINDLFAEFFADSSITPEDAQKRFVEIIASAD